MHVRKAKEKAREVRARITKAIQSSPEYIRSYNYVMKEINDAIDRNNESATVDLNKVNKHVLEYLSFPLEYTLKFAEKSKTTGEYKFLVISGW